MFELVRLCDSRGEPLHGRRLADILRAPRLPLLVVLGDGTAGRAGVGTIALEPILKLFPVNPPQGEELELGRVARLTLTGTPGSLQIFVGYFLTGAVTWREALAFGMVPCPDESQQDPKGARWTARGKRSQLPSEPSVSKWHVVSVMPFVQTS